MPLPMADRGWLSPDGQSIAYEPLTRWQGDWKHYHGGQTQPIWIAKLSDSSIEKVPRDNSTDTCPMWVGDKVYFLSDRDGEIVSLFSYDTRSKKVARGRKEHWPRYQIRVGGRRCDRLREIWRRSIRSTTARRLRERSNIRVTGDFAGRQSAASRRSVTGLRITLSRRRAPVLSSRRAARSFRHRPTRVTFEI